MGSWIKADVDCQQDIKVRMPLVKDTFQKQKRHRLEISWIDKGRNEEILSRVGEETRMPMTVKYRKLNWIDHNLRQDSFLVEALEGFILGKRGKGRRRYKKLDDIRLQ